MAPSKVAQRALEAIARTRFLKSTTEHLFIVHLRNVRDLIADLIPEVADKQALADALKDVLHNFSKEDSSYVLGPASAPNWIGLPSQVVGNLRMLDVADLAELVSDGIPVAWVPRASILNQLMAAADISSRHNLLLSHESEILDDCITAISCVKGNPMAESAQRLSESAQLLTEAAQRLAEAAQLLTEAAIAARAGHHSAAQALSSNVLDTALRITYPGRHGPYSAVKRTITDLQSNRELSNLRRGLALAPVMLAIRKYDGQTWAIPPIYNRHATAHAAGHVQYTKINAIISIMAATSALRECHELKWGQYRTRRSLTARSHL